MLSQQQKSQFLTHNNLQGDYDSTINIGLYVNGKLLAVAAFNELETTGEYELKCIASLLNHSVDCELLLQFFIQKYSPTSIIYYCDLRWNDEELYNTLGFNYESTILPDYQYFKPNSKVLMNKQIFQQHYLYIFNPELTEWENMKNNGYYRIWDCGFTKLKLVL